MMYTSLAESIYLSFFIAKDHENVRVSNFDKKVQKLFNKYSIHWVIDDLIKNSFSTFSERYYPLVR